MCILSYEGPLFVATTRLKFMYLKSSIWVLKEESNGAIVDMLSTPYLSWFDFGGGRQRWVVEHSHHCVALAGSMAHLLVGSLKE